MRLLNYTPHPLNIVSGNYHTSLQPAGPAPRLVVERVELGEIVTDDYPINLMGDAEFGSFSCSIVRSTMGQPTGLPEAQESTIIIVSALVAEHPSLANRTDLAYPGEAIRDTDGKIIGCKGLCAGPGLAAKLAAK